MSLFETNEPNANPIKKHPITFTVNVAIHEKSGKYIEKILKLLLAHHQGQP